MTDPVAVTPVNRAKTGTWLWRVEIGPLVSQEMSYGEAEALAAEVRAHIEQCCREGGR